MICKSYNDFFQALANRTNQHLISQLLQGPATVSELSQRTRIEQSRVSHSLKKLAECRLVEVKRQGKNRIYSLNKRTIIPILKIADSHARDMCPVCIKVER